MTDNELLESIINHLSNTQNISKDQIYDVIKNTDITNLSQSETERLISGLDSKKRQILFEIINTVR